MGVNNEYSVDAFQCEDARDEESHEEDEFLLDQESWQDWHSEHILNMWMSLRAYLEDNSLSSTLMTNATFHKFCAFVQKNSD
jgi:hypothetical protein